MSQRAPTTLIVVALFSIASGCGDQTTPVRNGDLEVTYRVGSGSSNCEEAGIAFIRVYVEVSETEVLLDEIFDCEPTAPSVTVNGIPAGTYAIRVDGLDAGNHLIFTGRATLPVTILADQTNGPTNVVLDQLRPSLEIYVGFAAVGSCDQHGVGDIMVKVFENGSAVILDEIYDCITLIDSSVLIEDLTETATFDVRVRGMNEFDEGVYEYNEDSIIVTPGAPTEIAAEMTFCDGVCSVP